MKRLLILFFAVGLSAYSAPAFMMMPMMGMGGMMGGGAHEGEVHPFLSHMGLPDEPGEFNLRLTGFQQRLGSAASTGYGAHLEVGLVDRLGLHVRNDDIQRSGTEIMLQYAVLRTEDKAEGFALIAEDEMPGATGGTTIKFKIGFTALKLLWGQPLHLTFHYDTGDKSSEYSAAQIFKVNERLALMLEYSGMSNSAPSSYFLEALKIKVGPGVSIGLGFQSPVSQTRDFDAKTLLQADVSW